MLALLGGSSGRDKKLAEKPAMAEKADTGNAKLANEIKNPLLRIFADPRSAERIQREGGDYRPMGLTKGEFLALC